VYKRNHTAVILHLLQHLAGRIIKNLYKIFSW